MMNIRKMLLLSALLMPVSSITTPMYAMINDEGDFAPRTIYAQLPRKLTLSMIQEIGMYNSFLTSTHEYVLINPGQLDNFARYLKSDLYSQYPRSQSCLMDDSGLHYCIRENGSSRRHHPHYDPTRPGETGPEWIEDGYSIVLSRLIFKEQDLVFVPAKSLVVTVEEVEKPVAASSTQASSHVNPSHEVDSKTMDLFNLLYKSDPKAVNQALIALLLEMRLMGWRI